MTLSLPLPFDTPRPNVTRLAPRKPRGSPILNDLLGRHTSPADERIIDPCHNKGAMWQGLSYRPFRSDIDARFAAQLDLVADLNALPRLLLPRRFTTLVADPIFIEDAGATSVHAQYTTEHNPVSNGDLATILAQIFDIAGELLEPDCSTIILKLGDQVHAQRVRLQDYVAFRLAEARGWWCDDREFADSEGPPHNTRKRRYHADSLVFWLVFHRQGERCPGPGQELPGVGSCAFCGRLVRFTRRRTANYCPPPRACRQKAYRLRRQGGLPIR